MQNKYLQKKKENKKLVKMANREYPSLLKYFVFTLKNCGMDVFGD